ncbi:26S protease regulatory subunit 10B [Xylographa carneopallida]|nr:26S protease regulatory subunit 10B [Xylographa carneopallida]
MDEVDAIGGRRFSQGTSADREIQRTLMELLNQLDGFDELGRVKMVMATNRPDTLDPALLRPGRLDRKIEIPIPSESNRLDILKIHSANVSKHGEIDYESVVKLCEGFNGADLRNGQHSTAHRTYQALLSGTCQQRTHPSCMFVVHTVVTEAGMFAIRVERGYVIEEDFMKAARKIMETKKLEGKLEYEKV